jgi:hypothetical protein
LYRAANSTTSLLDRCRCTYSNDQTVIRSLREFAQGAFGVPGDGEIDRQYLHPNRRRRSPDHRPLSEADGRKLAIPHDTNPHNAGYDLPEQL